MTQTSERPRTRGPRPSPLPEVTQTAIVPTPLTARLADPVDDVLDAPIVVRRSRFAVKDAGTYVGTLLVVVGAVLLFVAWGRTAGTDDVGLQVPYILSAGATGLALVAIGLVVISVTAKRADSRGRVKQLTDLEKVLADIREGLAEQRGQW